jgi:hypothetical protein
MKMMMTMTMMMMRNESHRSPEDDFIPHMDAVETTKYRASTNTKNNNKGGIWCLWRDHAQTRCCCRLTQRATRR